MPIVYLSLGTNMGDRPALLQAARTALQQQAGPLLQSSMIYESAAWGVSEQGDYLNQVVALETQLTPLALLAVFHQIEADLGRTRGEKWAARTMDIDILLYDDLVLKEEQLIIPHPLLQDRNFVLVPLTELADEIIHPVFQISIGDLYIRCQDETEIYLTEYR